MKMGGEKEMKRDYFIEEERKSGEFIPLFRDRDADFVCLCGTYCLFVCICVYVCGCVWVRLCACVVAEGLQRLASGVMARDWRTFQPVAHPRLFIGRLSGRGTAKGPIRR